MLKLREWAASERSWPALLSIITVAYWLSPRDWWAVITFVCVGVLYLALVITHFLEFWALQRKLPYLIFAFCNFIAAHAIHLSTAQSAIDRIEENIGGV